MRKACDTCEYCHSFQDCFDGEKGWYHKCWLQQSPNHNVERKLDDNKPCEYYTPNDNTVREIVGNHWEKLFELLGEEITEE